MGTDRGDYPEAEGLPGPTLPDRSVIDLLRVRAAEPAEEALEERLPGLVRLRRVLGPSPVGHGVADLEVQTTTSGRGSGTSNPPMA